MMGSMTWSPHLNNIHTYAPLPNDFPLHKKGKMDYILETTMRQQQYPDAVFRSNHFPYGTNLLLVLFNSINAKSSSSGFLFIHASIEHPKKMNPLWNKNKKWMEIYSARSLQVRILFRIRMIRNETP